MPLYDKPLIFYPLSVMMLAGIREVLIITNSGQKKLFQNILGNGSGLGIKINYEECIQIKLTNQHELNMTKLEKLKGFILQKITQKR